MPFDKTPLDEDVAELCGTQAEETAPTLWPIYASLVVFLVAIAASVAIFGLPGLYIPAVALVPVMYFLLIRISLG